MLSHIQVFAPVMLLKSTYSCPFSFTVILCAAEKGYEGMQSSTTII